MKRTDFLASSTEALKLSLEREKALLNELNNRSAIEACVFRILSCERRLYLMNIDAKPPLHPNSKKKER